MPLLLIVFGMNISDTTRHQMIIQFPPCVVFAAALPEERTNVM